MGATHLRIWTPGSTETIGRAVWTLRGVYETYLRPDDEVTKAPATIGSHNTSLNHFERLCGAIFVEQTIGPATRGPRTVCPGVRNLARISAPNPPLSEIDEDLLITVRNRMLGEGFAGDTVRNMFVTLRRVMRAARKRQLVDDVPDLPAIPRTRERPGLVESEEVGALYEAAGAAAWPQSHGLPAAAWWRCWLVFFWYFGMRTQDLVGVKSKKDRGLLWMSILDDPRCPDRSIKRNRSVLECAAGWLEFVPAKTKRTKGESLLLPRNQIINAHLSAFRGLDETRVFPNGRSKRTFLATFSAIRRRAGLSGDVTIADTGTRRGQRTRSIRKGASNNWDAAREGLGEWVLGHAARGTNQNYYKLMLPVMLDSIDDLTIPSAFRDGLQSRET